MSVDPGRSGGGLPTPSGVASPFGARTSLGGWNALMMAIARDVPTAHRHAAQVRGAALRVLSQGRRVKP